MKETDIIWIIKAAIWLFVAVLVLVMNVDQRLNLKYSDRSVKRITTVIMVCALLSAAAGKLSAFHLLWILPVTWLVAMSIFVFINVMILNTKPGEKPPWDEYPDT